MSDELILLQRARTHAQRLAIVDEQGNHTYSELISRATAISSCLLQEEVDLEERRVAFMTSRSFEYPSVLFGIWQAGGIAVPLCTTHPAPELEYAIVDAAADTLLVHPVFEEKVRPIAEKHGIRILISSEIGPCGERDRAPRLQPNRRAMILYTSGTTGRPKGAVLTHENIAAQVIPLIEAWEWSPRDRILHVLPLHHTHGITNVLLCALWAGATCEMLDDFDPERTWKRFSQSDLTLFMAVPTIYVKLIAEWERSSPQEQREMSEACRRFRLMVSGSAALPVSVLEKWKSISGHTLLERYGMTEIGMALSNPLHGERKPGFVGIPLPGIKVKLVNEKQEEISEEETPGEIHIQGPNVFLEYWRQEEATRRAFQNGWFRTGDIALRKNGHYRILGRNSVDMIKSGGYKVSALEVEEVLRTHPLIRECAVVGVGDVEWGERVCAVVVPATGESLRLDDLRSWAKERIAVYKIPTRLLLVPELPRNAMGKVTKSEVKELFGREKTR